jgi:DNA invertase Pin-like site-specific DNA recombinase
VFLDKQSGKSAADRPELTAALDYVREGDTLRVPSMDRLARNLADLLSIVRGLTDKGVRVEFVKEAQTFTGDDDAVSMLLLSLLGAVAAFERELIRERQAEGIAIAKANGVYKGRKPALTAEQVAHARQRVSDGITKTRVARDLGVSRQTLYSALA